ncbi:hypothetical protein EON77_05555 [bacterium]|nr:MAG: hypothetical protein EON77_05555 [bacterium]
MKPNFTLATALALVALSACGERPDPATPKVNENSTLAAPAPPGQKDVEAPSTGTNSGRPDGPKDLAPGTDGSGTPPPR